MFEPRKARAELEAAVEQYLKDHSLGVLATERPSGMPQRSIVGYRFDGRDIVISASRDTAKARNVRDRSSVSLAVTDGPTCLVISGEARLLDGAEAEAYLGEPLADGHAPTLIVFAAASYRWADVEH